MEITNQNFEETLKTDKLVVLDFWAQWCGPCRSIAPIIDELASEYGGSIVIGKVNVDDNTELSTKYGIRSIPTILFIKNGNIVDKSVGAVSKSVLKEKIDKNL